MDSNRTTPVILSPFNLTKEIHSMLTASSYNRRINIDNKENRIKAIGLLAKNGGYTRDRNWIYVSEKQLRLLVDNNIEFYEE